LFFVEFLVGPEKNLVSCGFFYHFLLGFFAITLN